MRDPTAEGLPRCAHGTQQVGTWTHVSFMSWVIPDSSSSIPGMQSSAVIPLMKVSSSFTVGGWLSVSNRPVVEVLVAQYLL
jgi:hypothetical protein